MSTSFIKLSDSIISILIDVAVSLPPMFITGEATVELGEAGGLKQVVAGVVALGALDADTAPRSAASPAHLVPADGGHGLLVSAQQRVVSAGLTNTPQLCGNIS